MSNPIKNIFKNTVWLTVAEIINGVVMFFLTIWLARYLGAEGYGKLNFALSFVAFFSLIVDLGLGPLAIRELSRNKELVKKYLSNIFTLRILLAVLTFILLVVIVNIASVDKGVIKLIYLVGIWTILNTWANVFQSVFRAYEKMEYESVIKVINALVMAGSISFVILSKMDLIILDMPMC